MKSMKLFGLYCALAAAGMVSAGPATAQRVFQPFPGILGNRVDLGCRIEFQKLIVITNITTGSIAAGTTVNVDVLHFAPPDTHETLAIQVPALAPGGYVEAGTHEATSCTAWIVVPLTLAPSGATPPPAGPAAPIGSRPILAP